MFHMVRRALGAAGTRMMGAARAADDDDDDVPVADADPLLERPLLEGLAVVAVAELGPAVVVDVADDDAPVPGRAAASPAAVAVADAAVPGGPAAGAATPSGRGCRSFSI
jgi:hypothetical protein